MQPVSDTPILVKWPKAHWLHSPTVHLCITISGCHKSSLAEVDAIGADLLQLLRKRPRSKGSRLAECALKRSTAQPTMYRQLLANACGCQPLDVYRPSNPGRQFVDPEMLFERPRVRMVNGKTRRLLFSRSGHC